MLKLLFEQISAARVVKLGRLLGMLLYFFDVPHRRLVGVNLKFCYPQWSRQQIRELCKRIFRNTGITLIEICQLAFISRKKLLSLFQVKDEANLVNALKLNRGVIIITAHIANWESGFAFAGCYFGRPLTGVARHLRNTRLDRWFYHLRTRFGNKIIFKKGALPEMRQTLRKGEIVALTMDQSRGKQAIGVNFFDHQATATPAAALLALRCKSPVVPMFCIREADGILTVHTASPIQIQNSGDLRADLRINTQLMMDAVEDMIRRYPDQWIWFQRPWKKTYPRLYPAWEARRRRRKKRKNGKLSTSLNEAKRSP